jgi:N-acetylglucosamine-6-phosphate deacetylase
VTTSADAGRPLLVRARRALVHGELRPLDLLVSEGVIVAIGPALSLPAGAHEVSVDLLTPGFVDLHVHALDGAGTFEPPDVAGLGVALARRGVTSFLATTAAAPVSTLLPLLAPVSTGGARCLGVHLEGPWLSTAHAGAQPRESLAAPDLADLDRLLAAGPPVMITLAPELPGAHDVIAKAAAAGVVVALGHSGATYAEATAAVAAGASHVTHCFNAMRPLHHREPGLVGAALDLPEITVEVIADGIHLHPAVVRLLWRACGPQRLCLVSDAVDLALPGAGAARLEDGTLAGSRIGLDQAVRNLVVWGVPLADALTMASVTPGSRVGAGAGLALGAVADLTLLDADLRVVSTVVDGSVVWER